MWNIIWAFIVIAIGLWLRKRREHLRYFERLEITGPPPNIIFGNILKFFVKNTLWAVNDFHRKYGNVVGLFYGQQPVLLVSDPKLLKQLLNDGEKFANRSAFFSSVQSDISCPLRGKLLDYYNDHASTQKTDILEECVAAFLQNVGRKPENRDFDISKLCESFALDLMSRSMIGINYDLQGEKGNEAIVALVRTPDRWILSSNDIIKLVFPTLHDIVFCKLRRLAKKKTNETSSSDRLRNDCLEKIAQIRKRKKSDNKSSGSFLESLLYQGIDPDQSTEFVLSNIHSGYTSLSSALSFITNMLIRRLDVQSKLREELRSVFGETESFSVDCVNRCSYLDAVIKETLRMYPPVYMSTTRTSSADVNIKGIVLPKGLTILASIRELHYTEEHWPEPEKFDPERFLDKDVEDIWMPFGAGIHRCPGFENAMTTLKVLVARLVLQFRLHSVGKQPVELTANIGILKLKKELLCQTTRVQRE